MFLPFLSQHLLQLGQSQRWVLNLQFRQSDLFEVLKCGLHAFLRMFVHFRGVVVNPENKTKMMLLKNRTLMIGIKQNHYFQATIWNDKKVILENSESLIDSGRSFPLKLNAIEIFRQRFFVNNLDFLICWSCLFDFSNFLLNLGSGYLGWRNKLLGLKRKINIQWNSVKIKSVKTNTRL